MEHLRQLPVYALVTTGRTGSDFLQSLLDAHPEVLTFNGHFPAYSGFFRTSICFNSERPSVRDIADEFVGKFIYKLVSRYDIQEGKDRLGESYTESLTLDTNLFRRHIEGLMMGREITSRDFLLAIYGAYNLCLDQGILEKKIVFHHPHLFYEFYEFVKDFPDTAVVVTTRDPRANFASHVEHFRRYYETHDNEQHLYNCLKMMLEDSTPLEQSGFRYVAVRLEDVPRKSTLVEFSEWLGITYEDSLLQSTWGGLDWHGDRLSARLFESRGWTEKRTENKWQVRLGRVEQYVFNYIMQSRLRHYRYTHTKVHWWDAIFVALLIPFPIKYERRFLSIQYFAGLLKKKDRKLYVQFALTPIFYFKRVAICYEHYLRTIRDIRFRGPWIGLSTSEGSD